MSLHAQLQQRQADNKPIRIGLIGAGKFGSMYLAQIPRTPGVHLVGIADLSPDAARTNLGASAGTRRLPRDARLCCETLAAHLRGLAALGASGDASSSSQGHPIAAVGHCLRRSRTARRRQLAVDADAFCGPLLAKKAAEGVVYSPPSGPAGSICDRVDWARTCGFRSRGRARHSGAALQRVTPERGATTA